jgi:hypothetical protein
LWKNGRLYFNLEKNAAKRANYVVGTVFNRLKKFF